MKVLFISRSYNNRLRQGILYLSGLLKANQHEAVYLNSSEYEEVVEAIEKNKPDLLAYSVTSGEYPFYNELNRRLKPYKIMSLIGGPHATFFAQEFMKDEGNTFDAACRGEGEYPLLDLCDCLQKGKDYSGIDNWVFKKDGKSSDIIVNPLRPLIENLDELPFPDFSLLEQLDQKTTSTVWFQLHRGCPFKCTYCMNHKWRKMYEGLGKIVRVASPRYCIDMMKYAIKTTKVHPQQIIFDDDTFGHNIEWLREFCDLYKKEINLPWSTHLYPTMINEKRIVIMKEAGCHGIFTAIETGNEEMRRNLLKRPMSNDLIIKAARAVKKHGLSLVIQNILLLPGETLKTAMDTFNLNFQCRPDVATASKFQPYPGLELTEKAIEMGYLERGTFENSLPDNFHWISILKFPKSQEKEVKMINNLLNLFTFGVAFPFLKWLVYFLIRIPNSKLHHHIDNTAWHTIHPIKIGSGKFKQFVQYCVHFFNPINIRNTLKRQVGHSMVIQEDKESSAVIR